MEYLFQYIGHSTAHTRITGDLKPSAGYGTVTLRLVRDSPSTSDIGVTIELYQLSLLAVYHGSRARTSVTENIRLYLRCSTDLGYTEANLFQ